MPVLRLSVIADALHCDVDSLQSRVDALAVPALDAGADGTLVDAEALEVALTERGAREDALVVRRARAGVGAPAPVFRSRTDAPDGDAVDQLDAHGLLARAVREHGGSCSKAQFARWVAGRDVRFPTWQAVVRALDASSWTEAVRDCGGRGWWRADDDREEARALLRAALETYGGTLRRVDYTAWAKHTRARWVCSRHVSEVAGFATWTEAMITLAPEVADRG